MAAPALKQSPQLLLCGGDESDRVDMAPRLGALHFDIREHWSRERNPQFYKLENLPRHLAGIVAIKDKMSQEAFQKLATLADRAKIPLIKWDRDRDLVLRRFRDAQLLAAPPPAPVPAPQVAAPPAAPAPPSPPVVAQKAEPEAPRWPPPAARPHMLDKRGHRYKPMDKTCRIEGCVSISSPRNGFICKTHHRQLSPAVMEAARVKYAEMRGITHRPTKQGIDRPHAKQRQRRKVDAEALLQAALSQLQDALLVHPQRTKRLVVTVKRDGSLVAKFDMLERGAR